MEENPCDILEKSIEHLSEWEKRYSQAQQIAPFIHAALEATQWEYDVVRNAPSPEMSERFSYLTPLYKTDYNGLVSNLPLLPGYTSSSTAATPVSGVNETYNVLMTQVNTHDPIYSWSRQKANEYEKIQENSILKSVIKEKLKKLNPEVAEEFEEAENYFILYKAGAQNQQASAITMRNVLESYKGELYSLSIRPPEQRIKYWYIFADRLCVDSTGSVLHTKLIAQEEIHKNLHSDLSLISKNMKTITIEEMISIHTKYINHLYTVLLSVKYL